jgi:hypothetical protein
MDKIEVYKGTKNKNSKNKNLVGSKYPSGTKFPRPENLGRNKSIQGKTEIHI